MNKTLVLCVLVVAILSVAAVSCQHSPLPQLPIIFTANVTAHSTTSQQASTSGTYLYDGIKQRTRYDYQFGGKHRASIKLYTVLYGSVQYSVVYDKNNQIETCNFGHVAEHPLFSMQVHPIAKVLGRERDEEGNKLYRWGVSVPGQAEVEWLVYNKTIGHGLVDYSLRRFKFSSNIVTRLENYNAHWEMSNQKALHDTNDDLFQVWEQSTKCPLPPIQFTNPSSVAVVGRVRNAETLEPYVNATVTLKYPEIEYNDVDDQDGWITRTTKTDSMGMFIFDKIPKGTIVRLFHLKEKRTIRVNRDVVHADFNVLEKVSGSGMKFVVSWQAKPLHLEGTANAGKVSSGKVTNGYSPLVVSVDKIDNVFGLIGGEDLRSGEKFNATISVYDRSGLAQTFSVTLEKSSGWNKWQVFKGYEYYPFQNRYILV